MMKKPTAEEQTKMLEEHVRKNHKKILAADAGLICMMFVCFAVMLGVAVFASINSSMADVVLSWSVTVVFAVMSAFAVFGYRHDSKYIKGVLASNN